MLESGWAVILSMILDPSELCASARAGWPVAQEPNVDCRGVGSGTQFRCADRGRGHGGNRGHGGDEWGAGSTCCWRDDGAEPVDEQPPFRRRQIAGHWHVAGMIDGQLECP